MRYLRVLRRLLAVCSIAALPSIGYAQGASITGTVTDSTGGVLPGVVVVATHEASGNTFETVTDASGRFRLVVRPGTFQVMVTMEGFAPLTRPGIQLLLTQEAVIDLELAPASLEESLVVTGAAPLLDISTSGLAGNIDPTQMESLPLNGRNWTDLAMLAPGSRQNASSGVPLGRQGYTQINIDGQQVTNNFIGLENDQPRVSRDVIAEFVLLTNRFDATMGRSAGMLVNAVTKSGTNAYIGSVSGFFRDDSLNAADHIQGIVLPYQNQQLSATFGGPVRRDRIHFFANYEYEREPSTLVFDGPFEELDLNLGTVRNLHTGGVRTDMQFSSRTRLSVRYQTYSDVYETGGGATAHPSTTILNTRRTHGILGTFTQVIGNRSTNELKVGGSYLLRVLEPVVTWAGGDFPNAETWSYHNGVPLRLQLRGYNVGTALQFHNADKRPSIRNDFSTLFSKGGSHSLKIGGEYIFEDITMRSCASGCSHRLVAQGGNVPANIAQLLPVWDDASTWNYDGFAGVTQRYDRVVSDVKGFIRTIPQHLMGVWVQDDWTVSPKLTLNVGLRWDAETGVFESFRIEPIYPGNLSADLNNFAPRLGFAYSLNENTVIRGGWGKFFVEGTGDEAHSTLLYVQGAVPEVLNDGRPNFPSNPFNGPDPTVAELRARSCYSNNNAPGCVRTDMIPEHVDRWYETPYSHQASIGVQRQLRAGMAVETNVVYTGGKGEPFQQNLNLSYDRTTGANLPYTTIASRPVQSFGRIQQTKFLGWSTYKGWESSFTKRMSDNWQASATYTLSWFRDARAVPMFYYIGSDGWLTREPLGFPVAPDMGGDFTLAATDQRHRAVFNGIWEGYGFQVSGLYFYGSGQRNGVTAGADRRDRGVTGEDLLRADGTILARNSLVGQPIHRVDMRVQRRFELGGGRGIDAIVEVFNLFNRANYGSYTTNEANALYGQPSFNSNIVYRPRQVQLGFRIGF